MPLEFRDLSIERGNGALQHLAMSWGRGPRQVVLRARTCQLERAAALPHYQVPGTRRRAARRPLPGVLLLRFHRLRFPATRHTPTIRRASTRCLSNLATWHVGDFGTAACRQVGHGSLSRCPGISLAALEGGEGYGRTEGHRPHRRDRRSALRPHRAAGLAAAALRADQRHRPTSWCSAAISPTTAWPKKRAPSRGSSPARQDSDGRRARQPRLRVGPAGRDQEDPHRRRAGHARRRHDRDPRHRLRRRQGVRRRLRPARARSVGRGHHQEVRARVPGRSAEARIGAGAAAHRSADRHPSLRADPGDGRRRAARDFSVPRLQPARGSAHAVSGLRGVPRPRAPRPARRTHADGRARLQRLALADAGGLSRSAVPPRRRQHQLACAGRCRTAHWRRSPDQPSARPHRPSEGPHADILRRSRSARCSRRRQRDASARRRPRSRQRHLRPPRPAHRTRRRSDRRPGDAGHARSRRLLARRDRRPNGREHQEGARAIPAAESRRTRRHRSSR